MEQAWFLASRWSAPLYERPGARVNRAYMHRAVRYLARQGVRQFIDVG
ncbi:SAM-dependent methyltransferase, partial [Streptomyces sp. NPDC051132]